MIDLPKLRGGKVGVAESTNGRRCYLQDAISFVVVLVKLSGGKGSEEVTQVTMVVQSNQKKIYFVYIVVIGWLNGTNPSPTFGKA